MCFADFRALCTGPSALLLEKKLLFFKIQTFTYKKLARAYGVTAVVVRAVSLGRSTASNDVVATILISLFPFYRPVFFPSVATYSHRRSARIKKLIKRKLLRMPKNLGVDTFPDPVGHFGAP